MRKWLTLIILLTGGLIMTTALSACSPEEKIPDNRTEEQYKLEQDFQPLFNFLDTEKKNFANVKDYKSSLYIKDKKTGVKKEYTVSFDNLSADSTGDYAITSDSQNSEYSVTIDNDGNLSYGSPVPENFNADVFNLTFKEKEFRELPISDYLSKHPEIYLKSITYDLADETNYFLNLKNAYQLSESSTIDFQISNFGYGQFKVNIIIDDSNTRLHIVNDIKFNEEG